MSTPTRVPGPVDDEAQSIYTGSAELDSRQDKSFQSQIDRKPGEVIDSTEPIEDQTKEIA